MSVTPLCFPLFMGTALGLRLREVREVRAEVARIAASFDPSLISPAEAERVVEEASATVNMIETIRALAAVRAAQGGSWRREGAASPAHDLARKTGTSLTKAREVLDTGEKLPSLPTLDAAARSGAVSPAQAAPIADAATADPAAEQRLVDKAKRASLGELRDECARTKAAAARDDEARHAAIHRSRHLRRRRCPDGAAELHYRSTVDEVAEVFSVVAGFANQAFDQARGEGRREPEEAYLADGLLAACRAAARASAGPGADTGGGGGDAPLAGRRRRKPTPTKVVVRIDWDALLRGGPSTPRSVRSPASARSRCRWCGP